MKCIIDGQVVLLRAPEGPLAAYIKPFAGSLRKQGYAQKTIHRQVLIIACFSRWLKLQGVALRSIASDHLPRYLRYRARRVRPGRGDAGALCHLLSFLRLEGAIPAEKIAPPPLTPAERYTQAYELYLREVRGLARATIVNYVPFVASFLKDRFGDGPVALSHLCANDVVHFVQRQASHLHRKRAKLLTSALRSFLQYARYRGNTKLDLAAAVPAVANWSMSSMERDVSKTVVLGTRRMPGPRASCPEAA